MALTAKMCELGRGGVWLQGLPNYLRGTSQYGKIMRFENERKGEKEKQLIKRFRETEVFSNITAISCTS